MEIEEALGYYELTTMRGWYADLCGGYDMSISYPPLITRHRKDVFRRGARGQTSPRLDEEIAA
jgi:hypothetical protein